ncbi:MAG: SMC family ATPase [Actinomycetota bacterium]|nr:SMC family ATPase [Actinomycetota bacterium]
MRPRRLELQGFGAFREAQTIDFEGVDYFALVGATGSGKSTIIDAICFALYGSVPRYDNRNLVAPAISQNLLEARVRFDFLLGDVAYTAVRVIRRTTKGATTKEARLQRGEEVLAGTADEVSRCAHELLGLPFEHFTRCVVLPQGEFSRFLHDKPGDRQDLLVELLNLGVYEQMRQSAGSIAATAKGKSALLEQRLEDYSFATEGARAEAAERVALLDALKERVIEAKPVLVSLEDAAAKAEADLRDKEKLHALLGSLSIPPGIAQLGVDLEAAEAELGAAEVAVEGAEKALEIAHSARRALPERDPLITARQVHARRAELIALAEPKRAQLQELRDVEAFAASSLEAAEKLVEEANSAWNAAKEDHLAQHLADSLVEGEPCPVCLQAVDRRPAHPPAPDIAVRHSEAEGAGADLERARTLLAQAQGVRLTTEGTVATLQEQITAADLALAQHPVVEDIVRLLEVIDAADALFDAATATEKQTRAELRTKMSSHAALKDKERDLGRDFDSARDGLIVLVPPPATRTDLSRDWTELAKWAVDKVPELAAQAAEARRRAEQAKGERAQIVAELEASCRECSVDLSPTQAVEHAIVVALERALAHLCKIEEGIKVAADTRDEIKTVRIEGEVAGSLAHHLSATGFERWIVNEALGRLVEGARAILLELSGGGYSLALSDAGDFQVVDHHNANETRSAKTLSGGETFLASLSLALALADHLSELAADGAARLEAIFLDEGFGTLDGDTLDTVAATVENLASKDRMVGIVTHVRDLAERVPVQYQVSKGVSSTVKRVTL